MPRMSTHVITALFANAYKTIGNPPTMQHWTSIRTINFQNIIVRNMQLRQTSISPTMQAHTRSGRETNYRKFNIHQNRHTAVGRLIPYFFVLFCETLKLLKPHRDLLPNPSSGKHRFPTAIGITEFSGSNVYIKTKGKSTNVFF